MNAKSLTIICCCTLIVVACGRVGQQNDNQLFVEANARRANVFAQVGGQESTLTPGQPIRLWVGDSLRVDEGGRAILRFSDLATVEILRQGDVQVRELSLDEQSPLVAFRQSGGTFANELAPSPQGTVRRLEIESDFATITATGTRFLLVREQNTPLEWLWAIEAGDDDLTVTAADVTRTAPSGTAYWIAPIGPPSQAISLDPAKVGAWLDALRIGIVQGEMGDVLWKPADTLLDTATMTGDVGPGATLALGDISITLEADGAAGPATYTQADCNQDNIPDIAMTNGRLIFDFRGVDGRVRAVDITVADVAEADSLEVLNPGFVKLDHASSIIQRRNDSILSLRSSAQRGEEPYHYAALTLADGCFLGISLTPPQEDGTAGEPRPAIPDQLCTVSAAGLNLRRGPDTAFAPPIRLLRRGDILVPLGRTAAGSWIRVQAVDDGSQGWISANPQFVDCAIPIGNLTTLAEPPTPVLQEVPTPTPAPARSSRTSRRWETPRLVAPADNAIFDAQSSVTLEWSAMPSVSQSRGLGVARRLLAPFGIDPFLQDDEYYQVSIYFSPAVDSVWRDVHLVKESSFVVPAYLNSREMTWDHRYTWSVAVVQRPEGGEGRLISPMSNSRSFYWELSPTSTPTPRPTNLATAIPTPTLPMPTPTKTRLSTATPTETRLSTPTPTETPLPTPTETPQT